MSDPHGKRWLADDPNFLTSLEALDRGLVEGDEFAPGEEYEPLPPLIPSPPLRTAPAPRPAAPLPRAEPEVAPPPSRTAAARAARPLDPARALDPARLLDTAPAPVRGPIARAPLMPLARPIGPDPIEVAPEPEPLPPLAFARPASPEPRTRRSLLDLFPPSSPELEQPPMEFGTAVGPQLPPRARPAPLPVHHPAVAAPSPLDGLTYEAFYGLREKPFSLSTDPKFQYQSGAHERAGHEIVAATGKRGGMALLTGPLGMGKTTLCRAVVRELDGRTVTSLVLEPVQSLDDLLRTMLVDFGVVAREDLAAAQPSREQLVATLDSFLVSLVPLQASAVVFLDEAQDLPVPLLVDLATLIGSPAARVLQVVLAGEPALTGVLKHADLRGLNASIARRTELGPLAADEISSYVMHRLSIAGANSRIEFDDAAIARLFELSAGSPRVVNLLCDRAMTRGQAASAAVIDGALIEASADDLDLEVVGAQGSGALTSILVVALFALLITAGAAAALWVSRDAVTRTIEQWQQMPQPPGGPRRRLPLPLAVPAAPEGISDGRVQISD